MCGIPLRRRMRITLYNYECIHVPQCAHLGVSHYIKDCLADMNIYFMIGIQAIDLVAG